MEFSKWAVSNQGLLRNNLVHVDRIFNIVDLDDYCLFRDGLLKSFLNPVFSKRHSL